jgi:hypothetical protein
VAAQPWRDPTVARADLMPADAAAEFADDEEPRPAFPYLTAAEAEVRLESGQPSGPTPSR